MYVHVVSTTGGETRASSITNAPPMSGTGVGDTLATDALPPLDGKRAAWGRTLAVASTAWTFGGPVVTAPGIEASEKDQPPPTARSGRSFASAARTAADASATDAGKNIGSATHACVFDQFCHQRFMLVTIAMIPP
jgi:hypothetical protein